MAAVLPQLPAWFSSRSSIVGFDPGERGAAVLADDLMLAVPWCALLALAACWAAGLVRRLGA